VTGGGGGRGGGWTGWFRAIEEAEAEWERGRYSRGAAL